MSFLGALFGGGPSKSMEETQAKQASLADSLMADFSQRFSGQTDILNSLQQSYAPLVQAGINQQGFSSPVLSALNSAAISNSAAAARNAKQAAGNFSAGQNTTSGLQSGVQKQIEGSIDSQATNQLATAQDNITQQNYATGRANYLTALQGSQAVANAENPTAFSSQAGQNLSQSFDEGTKINDEKNAQQAALWGGIASLAVDAGTFGLGGISGVADSAAGASQPGAFLSGGLKALGGG